ncbi:MAG: MFS transporter [Gammaproteobacteria bacterium]
MTSAPGTPPAGGSHGWNVVLCAVAYQGLSLGFLLYGTAVLVVPWSETFHAARADVLLVTFACQIATACYAPICGRLVDRVPIRRLVLIGLGLLGAGLALASRAQSVWQIVLVYCLTIAPASLLAGALTAMTLATRWFDERRGLAIGVVSLGSSVGGVIVPPLMTALATAHGWRVGLQWFAGATLLIFVPLVAAVLAREPPAPAAHARAPAGAPAAHHGWTIPRILGTAGFWVPAVAIAVLTLASVGIQINLVAHARDQQFSAARAALLLPVLSGAMAAGKILCGALSDRIAHRTMYWLAGSVFICAMLVLLGSKSWLALMLGAALCGFASGAVQPILGATMAAQFGIAAFGQAVGLAYVVMNVSAFGPVFAGRIYDRTGSYDAAFATFAALVAGAMLIMARYRPRASAG